MAGDREALVAAIRERPDDDGPRLVCADWFEEQGDDASVARAAFIRTQVARARLPAGDPAQSELEARELRLLRQHAKAWCGSHFVFKKSRFRRGFIEYVHLHLQHFRHHRRAMFALEPVRDVSLTGFMRAPDDLVRRVAACEEWRHVETLRIHHQGPHKSPRSNVVDLIESPHLTGLKSLRLPMLAIDADARRRLERAPVLARLSELTLPHLDAYPNNPGAWFSDGLPPMMGARLRSLRLQDHVLRAELLARLSAAPLWDGLRSLSLNMPYYSADANDFVQVLRDRLPAGLQSVRFAASGTLGEAADWDSIYDGLPDRPLRRLEVQGVPISAAAVKALLGPDSACELRELKLRECGLTDQHLAVLADSPGARHLESLHLSQYQGVTRAAADTLLTSPNLGSVVDLHLRISSLWPGGLDRLAADPRWAGLRQLELAGDSLTPNALMRIFGSPTAGRLVRLAIEDGHRGRITVPALLIVGLGRLPHLARLRLSVGDVDPDVPGELMGLRGRIWSTVRCHNRRADFDAEPDELPPLDEDLEHVDQWS